MGYRLTEAEQSFYLDRIYQVLRERQRLKKTLTYRELADKVAMPTPQRIHRITRLLEIMMKEDAQAGQPLRAALVVSRAAHGLPAEGFFDRADCLGLLDGRERREFHQYQLKTLFADPVPSTGAEFNDQKK